MNIVIIGAGPAGEAAARLAAKNKFKVTLIEKENLGGLCLNAGCIPTKTLLSSAKKIYELSHNSLLKSAAKDADVHLRNDLWQEMKNQKNFVIQKIRTDLEKAYKALKIEVIKGESKFVSKNEVVVETDAGEIRIPFDKAVIAAGSQPIVPPPFASFKDELLDNKKILDLENIPKSLAIIGGGAIGCEFACLFNALGSEITLIEKMDQILPGTDPMIVNVLKKSFEARGIHICDSTTAENLKKESDGWTIQLSNQSQIKVEQILLSIGRKADFESLQPSEAGIEHDPRSLKIDANLKTTNPNIYAAGDITGLSLLAHAGTFQGEMAVHNILGGNKVFDIHQIPHCLYTWPEMGSVGMSKGEAESKGISVKSQRFFFEASGRALAEKNSEGFIQILSDNASEKIIGAQIIGASATEIVHIIAVALKNGMSRSDLKEMIFAHPTFSEGIKSALER